MTTSLAGIVRALARVGGTPAVAAKRGYLVNITARRFHDELSAIRDEAPTGIVYYTGHGVKPDGLPYFAATADSDPGRLSDTAIQPAEVPSRLSRPNAAAAEQPEILVIFDCCFSGNAGIDVLGTQLANEGNPRVWTIASASESQYAVDGRFAAALEEALTRPRVGRATEFIPLVSVIDHVNELLGHGGGQVAALFPPRGAYRTNPRFFRNPEYEPGLEGLTLDDQEHWLARLRGGAPRSGSYLCGTTGRRAAVDSIAAWFSQGPSLAVLTGSPGSGKSTVAALPVFATETAGRDFLDSIREPDGTGLAEHANAVFATGTRVHGLHVRGLTLTEITARVADALGWEAQRRSSLLQSAASGELDHLDPRVVVIDGADEASDPAGVVTLAEGLARAGPLRVLLVARPHIARGVRAEHVEIDLDDPGYQDPDALAGYARGLLLARHEPEVTTPYRDGADVEAVARTIAARASSSTSGERRAESFLIAQLLARAVRSRAEPIRVDEQLAASIPTVVEAFESEFARLGDFEPVARHLLTALAWAKGSGLPWEQVWVPVARAIAEHHGDFDAVIDDEAVRMLLSRCGSYVVEDGSPSDSSVFRPFHDGLTQTLQRRPTDDAAGTGRRRAWERYARGVEHAIARALLDSVPIADGGRDWARAHWYVRRHLADHAAADDVMLSELVRDLDFLAVAEPSRLGAALSASAADSPMERAYRRARPLLEEDADVADRKAYLLEAMVGARAPWMHLSAGLITPSFQTVIAVVQRDDCAVMTPLYGVAAAPAALRHGVVSGSTDVVMAAFGAISALVQFDEHGRLLGFWPLQPALSDPSALAFGVSATGQLELWAVEGARLLRYDNRGERIRELPLDGIEGVSALAAFRRDDGSTFLSIGTSTGRVYGLEPDLAEGKPEVVLDDLPSIRAIDVAARDHVGALLALGGDHEAAVFDVVDDGRSIDWRTTGSPAICLDLQPERRAAIFADRLDLRIGDLPGDGGAPAETVALHGHARPVSAVAAAPFGERRRIVSVDADSLRYWDRPDHTLPPENAFGGAAALAIGRAPDRTPAVIVGYGDGTVRFWDPVAGRQVGDAIMVHPGGVSRLASGGLDDERFILSTIGRDGDARAWLDEASWAWREELDVFGLPPSMYWADHDELGLVRVSVIADRFAMRAPDGQVLSETSLGERCHLVSTRGAVGFVGRAEAVVRRHDGVEASVPLGFDPGVPPAAALSTLGDAGFLLAVADRRSIRLFDENGPRATGLETPNDPVKLMEFVRLGDRLILVSAEWGGHVRAWDPIRGHLLWSIARREAPDALAVTRAREFVPTYPVDSMLLGVGSPEGFVAMTVRV
ncbi:MULTISPECIES: NACHT and WD repeat domain-containing protein [unclassified Agromyces]|uniref:NACHT and WD repeat domain-containing protein n=1 Tax=unclassified Agromyces TaxID=2639701 RepID=UPI003014DF63